MALATFDLVAGLLFALVILLTPALVLFGVFRLITYLGDDRVTDGTWELERPSRPSPPTADGARPEGLVGTDGTVACPDCGTRNESGMTFCHECLSELPGE